MSAHPLRMLVNTFKQGEARESLPVVLLVRQVSDTVARPRFGFKGEVKGKESHIVERL